MVVEVVMEVGKVAEVRKVKLWLSVWIRKMNLIHKIVIDLDSYRIL
jgi:hypothetical protein